MVIARGYKAPWLVARDWVARDLAARDAVARSPSERYNRFNRIDSQAGTPHRS